MEYLAGLLAAREVLYLLLNSKGGGQTVWQALNDYRQTKPVKVGSKKKEADFPDALIVNKAKFYTKEKGETLDGVYTFDLAHEAFCEALR